MAYKKLIKVSNICQLLDKSKYPATTTSAGVTFTNNGDGTITANGNCTYTLNINLTEINKFTIKAKHKYLILDSSGSTNRTQYSTWVRSEKGGILLDSAYMPIGGISYNDNKCTVYLRFNNGVSVSNIVFKPQIFDLTEMYGAGHEPTTVEQFRQDFPEEMYDYSPYCWLTSYKRVIVTGNETYPTLTAYRRNLTCKTKNLFDIPLTRGYPSNGHYTPDTKRTFTVGTYILGLARNNFYNSNRISNLNISKNSISYKTSESGYGVSVPLLLPVGNTYTVSCKADNNFYPAIGISYYKEDGTIISYTQSEVITNNPVKSFTVPENTYYTLILFYGGKNNTYTFSNIQLELGSTATDYVPYGHL